MSNSKEVAVASSGYRHLLIVWVLAAASAALLLVSLKLPLWHLRMEAPQYKDEEALKVQVTPYALQGDLREIKVLNKYIGVRLPDQLPQLKWLPFAIVLAAGAGLLANVLPKRSRSFALWGTSGALAILLGFAAVQAQMQMHHIGHDRDPHAALKGVGTFTPPLLGHLKVANFELHTRLGMGAWLIAAGIALQAGGGWLVRRKERGLQPPSARSIRSVQQRGLEPASTHPRVRHVQAA